MLYGLEEIPEIKNYRRADLLAGSRLVPGANRMTMRSWSEARYRYGRGCRLRSRMYWSGSRALKRM